MKSKVTLWNAPVHLVKDLIDTWKTMDIRRWRTVDTLAVIITAVFGFTLFNAIKLVYLIYTLTH